MKLTREVAEKILLEAYYLNPGPWVKHSLTTAFCAEQIAKACGDIDPETAYICGLLHDIGKRYGQSHYAHILYGYKYMMKLKCYQVAIVCLTHSFLDHSIYTYSGAVDISKKEFNEVQDLLDNVEYNDLIRLIQICDAISGPEGVIYIEDKVSTLRRKYGSFSNARLEAIWALRYYFEAKMNENIFVVCQKARFVPKDYIGSTRLFYRIS